MCWGSSLPLIAYLKSIGLYIPIVLTRHCQIPLATFITYGTQVATCNTGEKSRILAHKGMAIYLVMYLMGSFGLQFCKDNVVIMH